MRTKNVVIDNRLVKAGPQDGLNEGEFIVYPSTFTRTPDAYGDVVKAGAFASGIAARKEKGIVLPGLFGHRMDDPDFNVAHAIDEGEDDHGWWVKGMFDLGDPKADKVYRLVKGRRLNELSFAYDVLDEGAVTLQDGTKANELRDLEVFEFSFVPVGANRDTSVVAVKSGSDALPDGIKAGRVLSAKNESELRAAYEAIGRVLIALDGADSASEASGKSPAKDEGAGGVKSEEPVIVPPVMTLAHLELAEREFDFIES